MNNGGPADRAVLVKESWARRVTDATKLTETAEAKAGETGKPQYSLSRFYDIRPAVLKSAWTQNEAGIYQATAAFVNSATGVVDNSFIFPVTAPANTSAPGGNVDETRFFVIWRARWEALPMPETAGGKNYVSGTGIIVSTSYDVTLGGYPISNEGVVNLWIDGVATRQKGDVELDKLYFQWVDSGVTLGTKVSLKTKRISVVTGITNGTPTKEIIRVLDA